MLSHVARPLLAAAALLSAMAGMEQQPPEPSPPGGGVWSQVDCEETAAGCDLGVGTDPSDREDVDDSPGDVVDVERTSAGRDQPVCTIDTEIRREIRDYWVAEHGLRPDQQLALQICDPGGPEWLVLEADADFVATAAGPSAADLAESARDRLSLPAVGLGMSPVGDQLVGLPTWLWIDPEGWGPVSRTVSVPGVSVTATATPVSVVWSTGDGGSIVCDGPGTPYMAAVSPEAPSPDCGHSYREVSPEGGFTVSATVRWSVEWAGAGESGVFPGLETAASAAVEVAEAPAVNVVPGGAR